MALEDVTDLQQLRGHTSDVTTCDFAPNFTLITGSSDKTIRLWDWSAGSGYAERTDCSPIKAHKYGMTCVRVSPQGAMFAAASVDGTTTLWGLRTAAPNRLGTLVQVNGDAIRVLRFAPDSSVLVTGGDNGAICVWDLIHRSLIRSLFRHEGTVQGLSFTADSQLLVSGCSSEVLHVWRVATLTDTTTTDQAPVPIVSVDNVHDLGVLCCDIAPHIRSEESNPLMKIYTLATSGNDHVIKIWQITHQITPKHLGELGQVHIEQINELEGHESAITCVKYSANSALLASASLDKSIKLWNLDGECLRTEEKHTRYVNCIVFSRDTTILASAGSNDKTIIIWNLTSNLTLDSELLKPHMHLGALFSASNNDVHENAMIRNAESDDDVTLLEMVDDIADGAINACRFFGNGILATGSGDKLVKIFNVLDDGQCLEEASFSPFEGHRYAVNNIDFSSDGTKLVSCSQDGSAIIWHLQTGEQLAHIPENDLSVRICKFSPNDDILLTAGDDEKVTLWNTESMDTINILEGHADSVTSASFTPDNRLIATVSNNGDFRLWNLEGTCLYVQDDAHDLGVQCCNFSQNFEPIPNMSNIDNYNFLLATCGNDGLAKLWRISVPKLQMENTARYDHIDVKLWRTLMGHGGNVMFVKFSPKTGEIVCSTATDRQARLWSVYSSECLHVLEHNSLTVSCSFSDNMHMLAVGCLDKTLWLWKLPQKLIFQTIVASKIRCRRKALIDWRTEDVSKWARELEMFDVAEKIMTTTLDGQKLLTLTEDEICGLLELDEAEEFVLQLKWLKQDELSPRISDTFTEIPDEFLCPITHELMRTPVTCSDGFTYEKQAITEWFLSGKFTSPMTNDVLPNTDYTVNQELRKEILNHYY